MDNNQFTYIIESLLATGILYLIYLLVLRNRPMLVFNRFMLLGMVMLGVLLPLFNFSIPQNAEIPTSSIIMDEVLVNLDGRSVSTIKLFQLQTLYFSVAGFLLMHFLIQVIHLYRLETEDQESNQYKLIPGKYSHFSFFNRIYINKNLVQDDEELETILQHEKIHVQQKHSLDVLLFEILKIVFWFNPFIWLMKKCALENHEYLADKGMLKTISKNASEYFNELLQTTLFTCNISLVNNFNHSLLKKRIIMMTKQNLKSIERFIPLFLLPILVLVCVFFACSDNLGKKEGAKENIETIKVENTEEAVDVSVLEEPNNVVEKRNFLEGSEEKYGEKVHFHADVMPRFDGESHQKFMEYIKNNLKYPEEAAKKGIQGKVFVQFIISSEGEIKDVKVVRGVNKLLDEEAFRVVKSSPNWTPAMHKGENVAVQFTYPIAFKLQ